MKKYILYIFCVVILASLTYAIEWDTVAYWNFEQGSGNFTDVYNGRFNTTHRIEGDNRTGWFGLGFNTTRADWAGFYGHKIVNSTNWTISFWYMYDDTDNACGSGQCRIINFKNGSAIDLRAPFNPDGRFRFGTFDGDQQAFGEIANSSGQWSFVVVAYNGSTIFPYHNGAAQTSRAITVTDANSLNVIMSDSGNAGGQNGAFGMIDELGVWNRTLNDSEVWDLYNWGAGLEFGNNTIFAEHYQFFNNETIVGQTEEFLINVSYNSTLYDISASFTYNNTNYTGTQTGSGDNVLFTRTLTAPDVPDLSNVTFYWTLTFENSSGDFEDHNSTFYNQTINQINIDDCGTHSTLTLNFTLRNEETQLVLNGATENASIEIDLQLYTSDGNLILITNLSQNYTATNNAQVCIDNNLTDIGVQLYSQVRYDADGYAAEFYNIQNMSLTNDTIPQNINLYDLADADTTEFVITFKDENFIAVEEALIDITRKYVAEGVFKSVEIPITDQYGQAVGHFDTDSVIYTIIVTRYGEILATFDNVVVVCDDEVIGDCNINLNAVSTGTELIDFETEYNLDYTFSWDEDARTITVVFTTLDGTSAVVLVNTTRYDRFGNTSVCSDTLTSSSGTLTCTIPASFGNLTVISELWSDEELVTTRTYTIAAEPPFGAEGIIYMLILVVCLALIFTTSPIGVIIGGIVGMIMAMLLSFYKGGSVLGTTSAIMWLIIAGGIIVWKIARRNN